MPSKNDNFVGLEDGLQAAIKRWKPAKVYDKPLIGGTPARLTPLFLETKPENSDESYLIQLGNLLHTSSTTNVLITGSQREIAITGMGGLGKSTLATAYFSLAEKNHLYEVYFWINAESTDQLVQAYANFLRQNDLQVDSSEDQNTLNKLKGFLANKKYLLVLDNAPSPGAIEDYLPGMQGHTIVTSRIHDDDWQKLELGVFQEKEALDFLFQLTGLEKTGERIEQGKTLAHKLGYLPLALEQAGKYIRKKKTTFAHYLESFKIKAEELFKYKDGKLGMEQENDTQKNKGRDTVYTTFAIALNVLKPLSEKLLTFLYYLGADNIPLHLLRNVQVPGSNLTLEDSMEELEGYSLLKRSEDTQYVSLHRLVQKVGRMRQKEYEGEDQVKNTLMEITRMYLSLEEDILNLNVKIKKEREQLVNHVSHMQKLAKFLTESTITATKTVDHFHNVFRVVLFQFVFFKSSAGFRQKHALKRMLDKNKAFTIGMEWRKKFADYTENLKLSSISSGVRMAIGFSFAEFEAQKAFEWIEKAAVQEEVMAQHILGWMYQNGHGVAQDYAKAFEWYEKAAVQEDAAAHNNLGFMYDIGQGVAPDYIKAFELFQKAIKLGNEVAHYNFAVMYLYGKGIPQNKQEAYIWFKKAFDLFMGKASSQHHYVHFLGAMYEHGLGIEKDTCHAFFWYKQAPKIEDAQGQANLGRFYKEGLETDQDLEQALELIKCSAEQKDPVGQFNLALMYRDGEGVEADDQEAIRLLKLAVEQKDGNAFYTLGWMYDQGRGVEKDKGKAEYYYNEGKKRFPLYAYYALGRMFELGLRVDKDLEQAKMWYQKAADLHHGGALEKLRNLGGDGGQKNPERSPRDKGKERIFLKEDQGDERDSLEEQQGKKRNDLEEIGESRDTLRQTTWPEDILTAEACTLQSLCQKNDDSGLPIGSTPLNRVPSQFPEESYTIGTQVLHLQNVSGAGMRCFFNAVGLKPQDVIQQFKQQCNDPLVRAMVANEIVSAALTHEELPEALKEVIHFSYYKGVMKELDMLDEKRSMALKAQSEDPEQQDPNKLSPLLKSIDKKRTDLMNDMRTNACSLEAYKAFVEYHLAQEEMMVLLPDVQGDNETGQRTEYTSIDAVAYLNKIGLKIYAPGAAGSLRLLHSFIPEGATQVVYLYHEGVHFQALIPRGSQ